jgi:hypothetical protein
MTKKVVIQWENGLGGSGRLKRIFLALFSKFEQKKQEKSVSIRPIRPIRSPIVSQPFLSCTEIIFIGTIQCYQNQQLTQDVFQSTYAKARRRGVAECNRSVK